MVALTWLGQTLDAPSAFRMKTALRRAACLALLIAVCVLNPAHVSAFTLATEVRTGRATISPFQTARFGVDPAITGGAGVLSAPRPRAAVVRADSPSVELGPLLAVDRFGRVERLARADRSVFRDRGRSGAGLEPARLLRPAGGIPRRRLHPAPTMVVVRPDRTDWSALPGVRLARLAAVAAVRAAPVGLRNCTGLAARRRDGGPVARRRAVRSGRTAGCTCHPRRHLSLPGLVPTIAEARTTYWQPEFWANQGNGFRNCNQQASTT